MAYIYLITNTINGKVYVGKTEGSIEHRFKKHICDSRKERCKNRPLYRAINKYGVENFKIELIEETDTPEIREEYWITYYNSYHNGYNATRGGDGKKYLDYDAVLNTYLQYKNSDTILVAIVTPKIMYSTKSAVNLCAAISPKITEAGVNTQ
jgi:group I intron endonuclease